MPPEASAAAAAFGCYTMCKAASDRDEEGNAYTAANGDELELTIS